MNGPGNAIAPAESTPVTDGPPAGRRSWLAVAVVALGLLLVIAVGRGSLPQVAALAPGGTPRAATPGSGTPAASPVASPGASPVAGTIGGAGQGQGGNDQSASEAINSITQRIVHSNPILQRAQDPTAGEPVFDPYGILTTDQFNALAGDANRLKAAGLPTLVYVRISLNTQQQSQQFAQSLVARPGLVETSAGAQNGLVVLVSMPPGTPQRGNIAIAYGAHALPVNGLNPSSIQHVSAADMLPQLKQGQTFLALQWGLRRFNYIVAYTPYAYPRLSSGARAVGAWLSVIAPVLAALAIGLLVTTWFLTGATWRAVAGRGWRRWLALWWPGLVAGVLCAMLIPLSVYARDRIGIFAATAVIVAMLLDVRVMADRPRRAGAPRVVTVTATLPARVAADRHNGARQRPKRRGEGQGRVE